MNGRTEKRVAEILIAVYLLIAAICTAVPLALGSRMSPRATLAGRVAFPVILALWVTSDARTRRQGLCYDFDTFIFFAWPVVLPWYLFRTRGARALLTVLYFAGLCLAAGVVAGLGAYGFALLLGR